VILSTLSALALAQYRWTDAEGHVTYGDSPPTDAKNLQKLGVAALDAPDPLRDAPYELRRAAVGFPVVLYTADGCAPCLTARASLQARGIPFSERAVTSPADLEELQRRGFGPTFPILTVGRQSRQGFEVKDWNLLFDAAGYPPTSQLPKNWQAPAVRPVIDVPPKLSKPEVLEPGNSQENGANTMPAGASGTGG